MKYEKPDVTIAEFASLNRVAYISENNGEKNRSVEEGNPLSGEGFNQERG